MVGFFSFPVFASIPNIGFSAAAVQVNIVKILPPLSNSNIALGLAFHGTPRMARITPKQLAAMLITHCSVLVTSRCFIVYTVFGPAAVCYKKRHFRPAQFARICSEANAPAGQLVAEVVLEAESRPDRLAGCRHRARWWYSKKRAAPPSPDTAPNEDLQRYHRVITYEDAYP